MGNFLSLLLVALDCFETPFLRGPWCAFKFNSYFRPQENLAHLKAPVVLAAALLGLRKGAISVFDCGFNSIYHQFVCFNVEKFKYVGFQHLRSYKIGAHSKPEMVKQRARQFRKLVKDLTSVITGWTVHEQMQKEG